MEKQLDIEIQNLYKIFSKYKPIKALESCDCCHTQKEKALLVSKDLSSIEESEISNFASSAMYTIGNENDFKYFLPRIFELLAKRQIWVDSFIILRKLDLAEWQNWSEFEKKAVEKFLIAWWCFEINTSYFDSANLIEINKRLKAMDSLLCNWKLEANGLENFVYFFENDYLQMKKGKGRYKDLTLEEIEIFTAWVEANEDKLENYYASNIN